MRVELGGHSGVALAADGQAGGGGFPVFVRLDHQQYGHFGGDGIGEGGGGDGYIVPVQDRIAFVGGVGGAHHRSADRFVGGVALLHPYSARLGIGVLPPVVLLGLVGFAGQPDGVPDAAAAGLPGEQLQDGGGRGAGGDGATDGPGLFEAAGRGGRSCGRRGAVKYGLDFPQVLGAGCRGFVQQPPFVDQHDPVVFVAPDGVPDVAVGKEAVGAGLAGRVPGHIAALLVFGPLGT